MRRIVSCLALVGIYAGTLALIGLDGGGCASSGGVATTRPATAQELRLGTIVELREAYATSENVVTVLLRSKLISQAVSTQARSYFRLGRDAIEAADTMIGSATDAKWSAAIDGIWKTLDDAAAIYAPNSPKPSASRKT